MGPTKLLLASAEHGEYNKRFDKALCCQVCNRVDRASATETADSGSISGRVKLMTIKIGIRILLLPCLMYSN